MSPCGPSSLLLTLSPALRGSLSLCVFCVFSLNTTTAVRAGEVWRRENVGAGVVPFLSQGESAAAADTRTMRC